ncbi:inositol 1,4,5-triphosphate receptor associated 1 isoform X2 [Antennarius striatus]|uniref:inositol 1,4,5-triphosphate receptor associated 1 isoform X2 n=1 Tax=Antennarius striatus TaxID=241820 RepID=UPI0035AEAC2C
MNYPLLSVWASTEMSEKDLEVAFSQIALAFRCDQYTLKQRLQAEEHARNLAEENIQLELSRGRETLETLKGLCLDSRRSKILQRLELSLDILGGTVERISNTAEVLGAVHQEARVSRAVELMVAHVENLSRRHDRDVLELEEAQRVIQQQNSCRNIFNPIESPEPEDSDSRKKSSHQNGIRRRVSISLISSKKMKFKGGDISDEGSSSKKPTCSCQPPFLSSECSCSASMRDDSVDERSLDPDETPSDTLAAQSPQQASLTLNQERLPSKQLTSRDTQCKNSSLETLRQRHKSKTVSAKKKAEKDKKRKNIHRKPSGGMCAFLWRRHLACWLYHCRWLLLCLYLCVFFCIIIMTYFMLVAL